MTLDEQLAAFEASAAKTTATKQALYERLVTRGLSITEETPFRKYATAIRSLSGEQEELTFQEKTVTPDGSRMSIVADDGYTGLSKVIIVGDPNLIPENIAEGVEIYGVVGTAVITVADALPDEYVPYKEIADAMYRAHIGTEPPADYMLLESNGDVTIGYLDGGTYATTMCSYNGAILPVLPNVDGINFATITVSSSQDKYYTLYLWPTKITLEINESGTTAWVYTSSAGKVRRYNHYIEKNEWALDVEFEVESGEGCQIIDPSHIQWSNFDITGEYATGESYYFPASIPTAI